MSVSKGKAVKVLSKSFVENHSDISEDEAGALVVKSEQKIRVLKDAMDNDEKLRAASQIKKDLESSYKSSIQYEKAKISFLLDKIEEIQSGDVNPDSSLTK